jgi:hypothetical protein
MSYKPKANYYKKMYYLMQNKSENTEKMRTNLLFVTQENGT